MRGYYYHYGNKLTQFHTVRITPDLTATADYFCYLYASPRARVCNDVTLVEKIYLS
jgi:hypothetical protein